MRKEISAGSIIILSAALLLSGCAGGTDAAQPFVSLKDRILETVLENDESGGVATASDIVPDQIFYGSFSDPEAEEALVVCEILNTPHAGGLDRRALILLETGSMKVEAYHEILADEVWVEVLPMSSGQDRILFSGKTIYQGLAAQTIRYFLPLDGQWTEVPVEEAESLGDFYFLADDALIVTSGEEMEPADILAVLSWNQDEGSFIPAIIRKEGAGMLSESEIYGFNSGFFNSQADIMNNMLLSSEYAHPGEIDLFQLFYNGMNRGEDQISLEEIRLLAEMDSMAPELDVMKITADEMDAFLRKKLGIGLEETEKKGLEQFYYLEEYDSYYVVAGDTNYEQCAVVSGVWESEDVLRLEYTRGSENGRWEVTLRWNGDDYLFISNVRVRPGAAEG